MCCRGWEDGKMGWILKGLCSHNRDFWVLLCLKWVVFKPFEQNYCDLIYVKGIVMISASEDIWMLTRPWDWSQLLECNQTGLWWELWWPWLPPEQCSLTKFHLVQRHQGLGCGPSGLDLPFHPHSTLLPGLPINQI